MEKLIDVCGKECERIRNIALCLESLANSFYRTGNIYVSERLEKLASSLDRSATNIHNSVGEAVADEIQRINQSSANMLNAALTGIEIAKNEKHYTDKPQCDKSNHPG